MHIYFHASFLGIALIYISADKVFVRTNDSLYASTNHYPQHVLHLYMISYLYNVICFLSKESRCFLIKSCVGFDFKSLNHSYVLYTYSALLSRILFTRLLL